MHYVGRESLSLALCICSAHPGLPLSTRGAPPHVPLDAHLMREPRHLQLRLHSRIDPHEHTLPVPLEGEEAIHGA